MTVHWPREVDDVLGGDHVVMLAYVTPASGVVLLPVTNFAVRDGDAGTLTAVNSSVAMWRKLDRIRRNPRIALAYHTRTHADNERSEYVLVQGTATLSPPIPDYPGTIIEHWERIEPWSDRNALWEWWQRVYALRVAIEVAVERVVTWPDLACEGAPRVYGAPLPPPPTPQPSPQKGTGPRIDHERAAAKARHLPEALLGWVGADGFPVVVPVEVAGAESARHPPRRPRRDRPAGRPARRAHRALVQPRRDRPEPAQAHGLARGRTWRDAGPVRPAHQVELPVPGVDCPCSGSSRAVRRGSVCAAPGEPVSSPRRV